MMGDRYGIVANARNAWPEADELRALGVSWVRTIVYKFDELEQAIAELPDGVQVIALLNTETEGVGDDLGGWEQTIGRFAQQFGGKVAVVECLNEWDLHIEQNPESIRTAATTAVAAIRSAAPALQAAGIDCVFGSVAGPSWPSALAEAKAQLTPEDRAVLAGVCFHPYVKSANGVPCRPGVDPDCIWQDLGEAIDQAYNAINADQVQQLPIWITEYGIKIGDAGGEAGQAEYIRQAFQVLSEIPEQKLSAACYFAWSDAVGASDEQGDQAFGLRGAQKQKRPAWQALSECAKSAKGETVHA